jgi:hypothetical protein
MEKLPLVARLLGYAGVLPFVLLFLGLWLNLEIFFLDDHQLAYWLLIYAAVILSFLGAVHWGVALAASAEIAPAIVKRLYIYSVVPSLLAWLVFLLPLQLAFFSMASLIISAYIMDKLFLFNLLKTQYQQLRLHLTVAVSILLIASGLNVA